MCCSEYVPQEARIASGAMALPMDVNVWTEEIMKIHDRLPDSADAVREVGFNIETVAGMVGEAYMKAGEHEQASDIGHHPGV